MKSVGCWVLLLAGWGLMLLTPPETLKCHLTPSRQETEQVDLATPVSCYPGWFSLAPCPSSPEGPISPYQVQQHTQGIPCPLRVLQDLRERLADE